MENAKPIIAEIAVERLRLNARHGVLEQERLVGNDFEVSVRVRYPLAEGCVNDEIEDTVSYADIVDIIRREMDVPSSLLEHVAWRIGHALRQTWPGIIDGSVTVAKLTPPVAGAQMDRASVSMGF